MACPQRGARQNALEMARILQGLRSAALPDLSYPRAFTHSRPADIRADVYDKREAVHPWSPAILVRLFWRQLSACDHRADWLQQAGITDRCADRRTAFR